MNPTCSPLYGAAVRPPFKIFHLILHFLQQSGWHHDSIFALRLSLHSMVFTPSHLLCAQSGDDTPPTPSVIRMVFVNAMKSPVLSFSCFRAIDFRQPFFHLSADYALFISVFVANCPMLGFRQSSGWMLYF